MTGVEDFLEKGKLLSPGVYEKLEDLGEEQREKLLGSDSLVLTENDINMVNIPAPKIESRVDPNRDGHVFISDFTDFYLERFEFLEDEIEAKMDENTTTVNKADGSSSVVGMVRKVEEDRIVVEDKTGKLFVNTDNKFLKDEVVGVKGEVITNDEKTMDPEDFIYPDIPLNKDVKETEKELKGLFVSDISELDEDLIEELDVDYIFVAGETEDIDLGTTVISLSNSYEENVDTVSGKDPLRASIGPINIMLHSGEAVEVAKEKLDLDFKRTAIELLKKRHLHPSKNPGLEDLYLLKQVPDIIHVDGDHDMVNYKGTTFISTSDEAGYVVNFKTREVEEVELT